MSITDVANSIHSEVVVKITLQGLLRSKSSSISIAALIVHNHQTAGLIDEVGIVGRN